MDAHELLNDTVDRLSDSDLQYMASVLVNYGGGIPMQDEDGFDIAGGLTVALNDFSNFGAIQSECWQKFNENPQLNSHVRDYMGMLTGFGFEIISHIPEVQDYIDEICDDIRNEFYKYMTKYVARAEIQGELFLALTVHADGFVEFDFMDPSTLTGGGTDGSGIYFHPRKQTMPVAYEFKVPRPTGSGSNTESKMLIPSVYCAHYPEFLNEARNHYKFDIADLADSKGDGAKFNKLGGYKRFIISWDKGFLTRRNLSHLKTTLEWINHYVNLKKWEIDHKKSSGSYLWVVTMEDMKAFRNWLKMSAEEKAATGLTKKKSPGGTLILPPGLSIECKNPSLSSISEQDTDIMHMITSGLNKPEDMVTGQTKGDTFSGVKASRGPQSDRNQDEIAYFERFLRMDMWRNIFFLKNATTPSFKLTHKVKKVIGFKGEKEVFRTKNEKVEKLIYFNFPISEISDLESKAKALLGVSHASVSETLGIPKEIIAKRLGFNNYRGLRYQFAEEENEFPDLPLTSEILAAQQSSNGVTPEKNSTEETGNKSGNTNKKEDSTTTPEKKKITPRKK